MKSLVINLMIAILLFMPSLSLASSAAPFNSQPDEIAALNSLPGSIALLKNSGGGCVRWEQRCKPNTFFPERTDCTSECVEYQDDASGSPQPSYGGGGGGGTGELSEIGWVAVIAGVGLLIWLLVWGFDSMSEDAAAG